jgi:hypothetical protein
LKLSGRWLVAVRRVRFRVTRVKVPHDKSLVPI